MNPSFYSDVLWLHLGYRISTLVHTSKYVQIGHLFLLIYDIELLTVKKFNGRLESGLTQLYFVKNFLTASGDMIYS